MKSAKGGEHKARWGGGRDGVRGREVDIVVALYLHISCDVANVTEARWRRRHRRQPTERRGAPTTPALAATAPPLLAPPRRGPRGGGAHLYAKLSLNFVQLSAD